METIQTFFIDLLSSLNFFTNYGLRIFPAYLLTMVIIGYFIYRSNKEQSGFFSWLFPKSIYTHASSLTDLKLFIFGRVIVVFGIFNHLVATPLIISLILYFAQGNVDETSNLPPLLLGFIILVASDFATYCTHRLHHEITTLWPFHSVHHSAEVLTPITVYRKHPIYDLISTIISSVFRGIVIGILLALFIGKVEYFLLVGTTVFYATFNLLGSNFRHSHIWFSYGRVLEHIFISPAQHQIHHSVAKEHWNKNYGEVFAIWDWMFGTLYVPQKKEILEFGIAGLKDDAQPHKNLSQALLAPIIQSWKSLKSKPKATKNKTTDKIVPGE